MFKSLLGELGGELRAMRDEVKHGTETQTIVVAKPFCTPARQLITGTFKRYGVRLYGYKEYPVMASPRAWLRQQGVTTNLAGERSLPVANIAKVTVSKDAAAWAEYLLLRTGELYVPGRYVNKRNEQWAKKHHGVMPPRWQDGQPWVEKNCKAGVDAWSALRKSAKPARNGKK